MPWEGADRAAWTEVRRLEQANSAPCHGLLALLRLDETDPVRRALEGAGFQPERVEAWVRQEAGGERNDWDGDTLGWERVAGRAEAFSATLGNGESRPAHLLLALLWDPWVWPWFYFHHGARPEDVLGALAEHTPIPSGPLPELRHPNRIEGTQRLVCPRAVLDEVLRAVRERELPGVAYGWTLANDEHAWFVAPEGVPLQAIIDEAVSPAS